MSNSSIWPIDKTQSGPTNPRQSGPGSDGNEGEPRIPQYSNITGAMTSDCLVSYPGQGRSYPSVMMQSVYSTAPANWASIQTVRQSVVQFRTPSSDKHTPALGFSDWIVRRISNTD